MAIRQSAVRNRLLRLLSNADFALLAPHLEPVDLPRGFLIAKSNVLPKHYYFHDAGIGSIVATSPEGLKAEIGLVGRDGVAPTSAIMMSDMSPHETFVQVPGYGHRIETAAFEAALASSQEMHKLFLRFVNALNTQSSYTAMSNAAHHVVERLARWILMCHDRSENDRIELTHEFLAIMLAVRRPSVTTSLHVLEGNKLIYSSRGLVTVRDRLALEEFAADAYGVPEREYERLLGRLRD